MQSESFRLAGFSNGIWWFVFIISIIVHSRVIENNLLSSLEITPQKTLILLAIVDCLNSSDFDEENLVISMWENEKTQNIKNIENTAVLPARKYVDIKHVKEKIKRQLKSKRHRVGRLVDGLGYNDQSCFLEFHINVEKCLHFKSLDFNLKIQFHIKTRLLFV